jgi:hypothetical protein
MSHLTTQQARDLVEGGSILRRIIDGTYSFHKFSGRLDGMYYECATPMTHDLGLDQNTSKTDAISAFKAHFETIEHMGTSPTIEDTTNW